MGSRIPFWSCIHDYPSCILYSPTRAHPIPVQNFDYAKEAIHEMDSPPYLLPTSTPPTLLALSLHNSFPLIHHPSHSHSTNPEFRFSSFQMTLFLHFSRNNPRDTIIMNKNIDLYTSTPIPTISWRADLIFPEEGE